MKGSTSPKHYDGVTEQELGGLAARHLRDDLDKGEARRLDELLASALRGEAHGPPSWGKVREGLARARRQGQRELALSVSGMAAAFAALLHFARIGAPSPWVVFGGLSLAAAACAAAAWGALRRSVELGRASADPQGDLIGSYRAELDRRIAIVRRASLPLLAVLVLAVAALATSVDPIRPSMWGTMSMAGVVMAVVARERWFTLPRLQRERASLG